MHRRAHQELIKRGGENITAIEVEAAFAPPSGDRKAAVVPVPGPLRREEVKAYIKLRVGLTKTEVPPDRLAAHGEKRLAKFKIPRYITNVEDFPRTPSRKIQKKVLIPGAADLRADAYDRRGQALAVTAGQAFHNRF